MRKIWAFIWHQGSNYTKAVEAIASVPFDFALVPPQFQSIL